MIWKIILDYVLNWGHETCLSCDRSPVITRCLHVHLIVLPVRLSIIIWAVLCSRSTIRDKIIPHAVSWFTGEALQGEDYEDDDDEEGGEDEDEDEDDEEEVQGRKVSFVKALWKRYLMLLVSLL